jgi:hypothetical protein
MLNNNHSASGLPVPSLRNTVGHNSNSHSFQQNVSSTTSSSVQHHHQLKGLSSNVLQHNSDILQGTIGANTMLAKGAVSQLFHSANLPEVVKTTFKALHDVIVAQGETIQRLERTVCDKADWAEVEASLAARATVSDVNRSLGELTQIVDRKAGLQEVKTELSERPMRKELDDTISNLYELIRNGEKERNDLQSKVNMLEEENRTKAEVNELDKFASKVDFGATTAKVDDFDVKLKQTMSKNEIITLLNDKYMTKNDMLSTLENSYCKTEEVHRALQNKCDVQNVIDALDTKCDRKNMEVQWKELSDAMLELEDKIIQLENNEGKRNHNQSASGNGGLHQPDVRDLMLLLEQKANSSDMEVLLSNKIDRIELTDALRVKINGSDLDARLRANAEMIANEVQRALLSSQQEVVKVLNKKAYKTDVARSLQGKANLDEMMQQLERKVNTNEVRDLLSNKADLNATQRALEEKVDRKQFQSLENNLRALSGNVIRKRGGNKSIFKNRGPLSNAATNLIGDGDEDDEDDDVLSNLKKQMIKRINKKCDIEHVTMMLDQKADTNDVEDAINQLTTTILKDTIDNCEPIVQLKNSIINLNKHISMELMVGRWIWKSGRLNKGKAIPWNVSFLFFPIITLSYISSCIHANVYMAAYLMLLLTYTYI